MRCLFRWFPALFLLLSSPLWAASPKTTRALYPITVSGKLLVSSPQAFAHVQLTRFHYTSEKTVAQVKQDGSFALQAKAHGLYWLKLSALHHKPLRIALLIVRSQAIVIHARLATIQLPPKIKKVYAVGTFNEFARLGGKRLKRGKDGVWRLRVATKVRHFSFQLHKLTRKGSAMAGTQGDAHRYVKGLYRTTLVPKNGHVTLVFDPRKLPQSTQPETFSIKPAFQARFATMVREARRATNRFWGALRAFGKAERKKKVRGSNWLAFSYDLNQHFGPMAWRLALERDPLLRNVQRVLMATLPVWGKKQRPFHQQITKLCQQLIKTLPTSSFLWGLSYRLTSVCMNYNGISTTPAHRFYLRLLRESPNPGLRFRENESALSHLVLAHFRYGPFLKKYPKNTLKHFIAELRRIYQSKRKKRRKRSALKKPKKPKKPKEPKQPKQPKKPKRLSQPKKPKQRRAKGPVRKVSKKKKRKPSYLEQVFSRLRKDPEYFRKRALVHFAAIEAIAHSAKDESLRKRVRYSRWRIHSSYGVGAKVPDFRLPLFDPPGRVLTQRDLIGGYTLLVFWATWCGSCTMKIPMLAALQKEYRHKKLRIISISLDKSVGAIHEFRKKRFGMKWMHGIFLGLSGVRLREKFEVASLPKMMLVGPDGRIAVDFFMARSSLFRGVYLRQHLGPPRPASLPRKPRRRPTTRPTARRAALPRAASRKTRRREAIQKK